MAVNNLQALLAQADKQRGFPVGTMASVMQQETGGNNKYLADPSTYHYGLNGQGQRIAGHTGKVSTAFGPFGILESTGRDPGYGVQPLQNKSIEEQVRFASDYLDARSKSAGSLQAGLAGYGEGEKYSRQVTRRRDGGVAPVVSVLAQPDTAIQQAPPELVAAVPSQQVVTQVPVPVPTQVQPVAPEAAPVQVAQAPTSDPGWEALQRVMPQVVQPSAMNYGPARVPQVNMAGFQRFTPFGARG